MSKSKIVTTIYNDNNDHYNDGDDNNNAASCIIDNLITGKVTRRLKCINLFKEESF